MGICKGGWLLPLLVLLIGCSQEPQPSAKPEVPAHLLEQAASRQVGKRLFLRLCRECHGTLSEGRNPRAERFIPSAPDFLSRRYVGIDPAYLYRRIRQGKRAEPFYSRGSVMPAWGPYLSETEIWQLVAYLRQRARLAR